MIQPAIAVITPNILMGVGLRTILEKVIPKAEISVFASFAEFADTDTAQYAHYFTTVQVFVHHSAFFLEQRQKTILLGSGHSPHITGMHRIDTCSSEERLVRDLLRMRSEAPRPDHHIHPSTPHPAELLTAREEEVLTLIVRGLLNKQIAQQLHIGITTVITHRRNIMDKLGVGSAAALIVHAVGMGYADVEEV